MIICCTAYSLKAFSHTASNSHDMFFLQPSSHPFLYSSPDSITFWFQQRLVLYYIALRCVLLPHRFMSQLKDGCPIFCMDSSAGGIVCVLKALVRCALRTYGPHSHVILPDSGHFCHILPLACVSQWFAMWVFMVWLERSVWMCLGNVCVLVCSGLDLRP